MMLFSLLALSAGLFLIGTALSDVPDPRAYAEKLRSGS